MCETGDRNGAGDRRTVRVPRYRSGDRVVGSTEVDAVALARRWRAEAVRERVVERCLHEPGVAQWYVDRERGPRPLDGVGTDVIRVLVRDGAAVDALDLPEHVAGVPVVVEVGRVSDD